MADHTKFKPGMRVRARAANACGTIHSCPFKNGPDAHRWSVGVLFDDRSCGVMRINSLEILDEPAALATIRVEFDCRVVWPPGFSREEVIDLYRHALIEDALDAAKILREKQASAPSDIELATARATVRLMNEWVFINMGLRSGSPPDLSELSLREMLEAVDMVRANPKENSDGSRTVTPIPDERIIAALYVISNYEAQLTRPCIQIISGRGKALVVVKES